MCAVVVVVAPREHNLPLVVPETLSLVTVGQHRAGEGVLWPREQILHHDWQTLTYRGLTHLTAGRQGLQHARPARGSQQGTH